MSDEHGGGHNVKYGMIFIFLCIFTALSVAADAITNRTALMLAVMLIACCKAQFVLRYFMHLKFEGKWKYVVLLPTTVLALAIPFTIAPDIAMVYYDIDVPQQNTLLEKEQKADQSGEDADSEHEHDAAEHGGGH
jgi:cytochrome c oxidase subunit IV